MTTRDLTGLLAHSARATPRAIAIEEPPDGSITYGELAVLSDSLRDRLRHLGVRRGDRVGIYVRKSIDAIASIFGVLKAGAAYVPVDPAAPAARNAYILHDCSVAVVVIERRFEDKCRAELARLGASPRLVVIEGTGGGRPLATALAQQEAGAPRPAAGADLPSPDDLAYILYTSGSTGKPKGVMVSHRGAVGFVDWCAQTFTPTARDRFSSHAPLHFDLSILDLYLSVKHGATLVLIEDEGRAPQRLAPLISERRISIWYSAPAILSLLAQYGNLSQHDCSALRLVLFAGEVFPVKHLRALESLWPRPRYFNLYGPTETNVCTAYEIPRPISQTRTEPFPIGKACAHLQTNVVDEGGHEVSGGGEGELCVAGPSVMLGYWNLPEQTARAFLEDRSGRRWYRTGDIVRTDRDGHYVFVGRRDRMVKRRGYRVELGEIEVGLYRHPAVAEAAVIALSDEDVGVRLKAFVSCREGQRPSLIELKRFCAENLPLYMVPDLFSFQSALPKTSTDKIDYQRLRDLD